MKEFRISMFTKELFNKSLVTKRQLTLLYKLFHGGGLP